MIVSLIIGGLTLYGIGMASVASLVVAAIIPITFGIRYFPFALAGRATMPPLMEAALQYVPPAVLVAITVPGTLLEPGVHMIVLEGREDEAAAYAAVTELRFRVERD